MQPSFDVHRSAWNNSRVFPANSLVSKKSQQCSARYDEMKYVASIVVIWIWQDSGSLKYREFHMKLKELASDVIFKTIPSWRASVFFHNWAYTKSQKSFTFHLLQKVVSWEQLKCVVQGASHQLNLKSFLSSRYGQHKNGMLLILWSLSFSPELILNRSQSIYILDSFQ